MSYDIEALEALKRSLNQIGQIYAVIRDYDGEILAGRHRLKAGATHIVDVDTRRIAEKLGISVKMAKMMIILHSNVQRKLKKEETKELILQMAKELEAKGVPKEQIASELYSKYVPYSKYYILSLLPDEYKQKEKAVSPGRPKKHDSVFLEKQTSVATVAAEKRPAIPEGEKASEEQLQRLRILFKEVYGEEPDQMLLASLDKRIADELIKSLMEEKRKGQVVEPISDDQFKTIVKLQERLQNRPLDDLEKQYLKTLTRDEAEKMIKELRQELKLFHTEESIKQQIHNPVSRVDVEVPLKLNELGISGFQTQQPICVYQLIPDLIFPDKKIMVFFDGPGHVHTDLEADMRDAMRRRGWRVLELEYERYSRETVNRLLKEILEILNYEKEVEA